MEGGEWQRSCAHVWFLLLLIPCLPAILAVPAIHRHKETIKHTETTCKLGRKDTGGTSKGEAGSGILREDKGMEGAACHPGTAQSPAYALAQDPILVSASQAWHCAPPTLWNWDYPVLLPGVSGTAWVWEAHTILCPDPSIPHLALREAEEVQGMQ